MAPAIGHAARPTVTHVGLVPVEETERGSQSPRSEIRVADGTQENSTNASKMWSAHQPTCSSKRTLVPPPRDLLRTNDRTPSELSAEDGIVTFMDLPERGGGSVEQTSLSALIGWGYHGSALSGRSFGHAGKPRPHSTRAHTRQREVTKFVEAEKELPEILPRTASRRFGE